MSRPLSLWERARVRGIRIRLVSCVPRVFNAPHPGPLPEGRESRAVRVPLALPVLW